MVKPLNDYVLLKPMQQETKIGELFIVKSDSKNKSNRGVVAALPDKIDEKVKISIGDIVFYKEYSSTEIEIDNESLILIQMEDIIGKVINNG